MAGGGVWEVELIREMNDYMSTQKLVRYEYSWLITLYSYLFTI